MSGSSEHSRPAALKSKPTPQVDPLLGSPCLETPAKKAKGEEGEEGESVDVPPQYSEFPVRSETEEKGETVQERKDTAGKGDEEKREMGRVETESGKRESERE